MKNLVVVILVLLFQLVAVASNNSSVIEKANKLYADGKYTEAIVQYEQVIKEGMISPHLFYNLGNAYYKEGKIALAILNYEKAKKLSPADEDIIFNLNLANSRIIDKIDALPTLFIQEWKSGLLSTFTEREWSILCIVFSFLFIITLGIFIVSKKIILKQIGLWSALLFFVLSVAVFFVAKNSYASAVENKEAIILSPSIHVKGSPSEKGTKLFILHEGTKVRIESIEDRWIEIRLANGNVGWLPLSSVGII